MLDLYQGKASREDYLSQIVEWKPFIRKCRARLCWPKVIATEVPRKSGGKQLAWPSESTEVSKEEE